MSGNTVQVMSIQRQQVNPSLLQLYSDQYRFTDAEIDRVLERFFIRRLRKKDHYLEAGDVCRYKAYINKGCTRTYVVDAAGHERILLFSFEDWWVGDIESYQTQLPCRNSVQAMEDTELLLIQRDDFIRLEQEIPKLREVNQSKINRMANAMWTRLAEEKTSTPEERYLHLLQHQPHIIERIPLQYVAAYLNIEPQSLSRLRRRLSKH